MHYRSVSTDNKFIRSDRQVHPRGSTPLGFVDPSRVMPANVPHAYTERQKEYRALLARGATKFMCETFLLEFTPDTGIIAWADEGLFKEFSRPAMEVGDKWKIHLGRRIELSEEDADGAMFIEELLEEAVYFPSGSNSRWITHEEEPGLWVTSPNATVITEEDFDEDKDEIDCDENGFSFSSLWDQIMPVEEESTGGNEPDDEIPDDEIPDANSDASFDSVYAVEISNQIPEAIRPNAYESDDDGGPDTDQFEVVPDEAITAATEDDAYWSEISMESEDIEDEAEEDEDEVMA